MRALQLHSKSGGIGYRRSGVPQLKPPCPIRSRLAQCPASLAQNLPFVCETPEPTRTPPGSKSPVQSPS